MSTSYSMKGAAACLGGFLICSLISSTSGGEPKKPAAQSLGFMITEVVDTNEIKAKLVVGNKTVVLEMANIVPLGNWPKNLGKEEQKLHDEAKLFLSNRLKNKRIVVTGIENGNVIRGDLVNQEGEYSTQGAPSMLGWAIVHLNAMFIERGYSIYQKDYPEVFFSETFGNDKRERDVIYKQAEEYAIKNKSGIWKLDGFADKLKLLSKSVANSK